MRHQLSLNRLFELEERPISLPGQGGYWRVNLNAPPGTKRPRKRGLQDRSVAAPFDSAPGQYHPQLPADVGSYQWSHPGTSQTTFGYNQTVGQISGGHYIEGAHTQQWYATRDEETSRGVFQDERANAATSDTPMHPVYSHHPNARS